MKKSILIGAFALITLAACQNEREDNSFNSLEKSSMSQRSDKTFDPLVMDGGVYGVLNTGKVYYMGRELHYDDSNPDAMVALNSSKEAVKRAMGRTGSVTCNVNVPGGGGFSFVTVSGDGQPNSYWWVFNSTCCGIHAYQLTSAPSTWDCAMMHVGLYESPLD